MKIERINDNQIKCTLSRADLKDHELKLSELAFGTDKAKALFQDMMEEANERFGFEPNDNPLMIEAIPVNPDCIILLITKMNHPEEIDDRMAEYSDTEEDSTEELNALFPRDLEQNMRNVFKQLEDSSANTSKKVSHSAKIPGFSIFDFGTLDDVIAVSRLLDVLHLPGSALYYSKRDDLYYLVVHFDGIDPAFIPSILSTLHEFGTECQNLPAIEAYFMEHCDIILKENAIEKLASI